MAIVPEDSVVVFVAWTVISPHSPSRSSPARTRTPCVQHHLLAYSYTSGSPWGFAAVGRDPLVFAQLPPRLVPHPDPGR